MRPLNGKPTRRGMRRAMRGVPTGRRGSHQVQVTPGRKHERRAWDALMAAVFAAKRPGPDDITCEQAHKR